MKILAIIPARSGSKGLTDKNILEMCGKPLLAYAIEAAVKSGVFADVVLSTDSKVYSEIAREFGASVPFMRPAKLSSDIATSSDVIIHVVEELKRLNKKYEAFMLLQPTSPLRTSEDIQMAVELFDEKGANAVISVCETDHNPLWSNTLNKSLLMDNFINKFAKNRRQELPVYYRINGAIYLSKIDYFLKYRDFYHNNSVAFIMNKEHSVDIDDKIDFILAEELMKQRFENC